MDNDVPPPPILSKLKYYGDHLSKRFIKESALYDKQKEALESLAKWFSEDNEINGEKTRDYTAVVSMPTGTGKTAIMCCLPYYFGGAGIDVSKPILVIAPGLEILTQLEENLHEDPFLMRPCIGLIRPDETHYGYTVRSIRKTADVKTLKNAAPYDIVLTNAQKWRKCTKKNPVPNYEDLPPDLFSTIIVDEAHHLPAKQWQEILNKFTKIVFFTATPYRADKKEITKDLALKKVGFAYQLSRDEAVKANIIRDVEWHTLSNSDETPACKKQKIDDTLSAESIGNNEKKINDERMDYAAHVLVKVKELMKEKNQISRLPGGKKHASIIVAYNIDKAIQVSKMCETLKFDPKSVAVVHSENKKWANEQIVDYIKKGKYEVVIIVQMLLEGFDYPPFSIAGIVTRIRSQVKFSQFIGRVQRIVREKNDDGKDEIEENIKADVVTHEYFKQEELIEKYCSPVIEPEKEDESLDLEDKED